MKLRKLRIEDAPLMLEWMHDFDVVQYLRDDFINKTLIDCQNFIEKQNTSTVNINLAVTDDSETYMGTVSLKNIYKNTAEFAIVLRTCAMGKGYSKYAMEEIMKIGFEEKKLSKIYWCVSPQNKRAIRFYEKMKAIPITSPESLVSIHALGGGVRQTRNSKFILVLQDEINKVNILNFIMLLSIKKIVKDVVKEHDKQ